MSEHPAVALYHYGLALRRPLNLGPITLGTREGLLVQVGTGWGDIAPLPGFSTEGLQDAIEDATTALRTLAAGGQPSPRHSSVRFGLDCARLPWPPPQAPSAPSYALLAGDVDAWLERGDPWVDQLPNKVKIKVGRQNPESELALIGHLCAARPDLTLVLDANGAWSRAQAIAFCSALASGSIAYLEDPCETLEDIRAVAVATGMPVALDWWVAQGRDWQPFPGLVAVVVKPMLMGAIAHTQRLVDRALDAGLSVVVSSAFESGVGLTHLRALASKWSPEEPPGLDTRRYFEEDVLTPDGLPDLSRLRCLWRSPAVE
jgi:O-succinylbenzoate synthase